MASRPFYDFIPQFFKCRECIVLRKLHLFLFYQRRHERVFIAFGIVSLTEMKRDANMLYETIFVSSKVISKKYSFL